MSRLICVECGNEGEDKSAVQRVLDGCCDKCGGDWKISISDEETERGREKYKKLSAAGKGEFKKRMDQLKRAVKRKE